MIKNRPKAESALVNNPKQVEETEIISATDFLSGLITDLNPSNIPINSLQSIFNFEYCNGVLTVRNGLVTYGLSIPDTNKILSIFTYFDQSTNINILRITKNSIYRNTSSGWLIYTGIPLTGTDLDFFSFTVASGRGFFSNGGVQQIQELFPLTATYAPLGNAPKYKYILNAFNRVIGLNRVDTVNKPYEVGWSGDLNYGEWNPLVDISAGSAPLVDTPSDLNDDITGGFSLNNVFCITRQRSIWLAQNQPSATDPFFFYTDVPKVGCDCPQTIKIKERGLVFYNYEKNSVYYYTPGEGLEDLSVAIKHWIKSAVLDTTQLFANFNGSKNTYTLFYQNTFGHTLAWTYNFDYKNWSYQEYVSISFVTHSEFSQSFNSINDLIGSIDSLGGTINNLSLISNSSADFYGNANGKIGTQPDLNEFISTAKSSISTPSTLVPLDFESSRLRIRSSIASKTIESPLYNTYINRCTVEIIPYITGSEVLSFTLSYSTDKGATFKIYKALAFDNTTSGIPQLIRGVKLINCRSFIWSIDGANAIFSVLRFDVEYTQNINNSGTISRR